MEPNEFRDDDEAAQYWLTILHRGLPHHKALARTEIGLLLEKRGLLEQATEAYWTNVDAKVPDPRPYERLAAIYRGQGDRLSETLVLRRMAEVFPPGTSAGPTPVEVALAALPAGARPTEPKTTPAIKRRRRATRPLDRRELLLIVAAGIAVLGGLTLLLSVLAPSRLLWPAATFRVPARCYDAAVRFPGADNPEAAVRQAYVDSGIALNPSTERFIEANAPNIVGGWVGVALLLDHRGERPPTLAEWVSTAPEGMTLNNVLLTGRTIDSLLSESEWDEIQSWPADSCEGAFVKNPRNTTLMRLVEAVVAGD